MMHLLSTTRQRGFTLVELMVALAIFSIFALIGYGGLDEILEARDRAETQMDRLNQLGRAMLIMQDDLAQLRNRPVKDNFGSAEPRGPLLSGEQNPDTLIEFTRGGYSNVLDQARSTLARVQYRLDDDGQLIRQQYPMLDAGQDPELRQRVLLDKVDEVEFRFLEKITQWRQDWPAQNLTDDTSPTPLPRAIEIKITLQDLGEFTRIFAGLKPAPATLGPN